MYLDRETTRTLEVMRASATGAETEWGQEVRGTRAAVASFPGFLAQLTEAEVASLADAGARLGDWRLVAPATFLAGSGVGETSQRLTIRGSDTVRDTGTGATYEVRSVIDAGGLGSVVIALLRSLEETDG